MLRGSAQAPRAPARTSSCPRRRRAARPVRGSPPAPGTAPAANEPTAGQRLASRHQVTAADLGQRLLGELLGQPRAVWQADIFLVEIDVFDHGVRLDGVPSGIYAHLRTSSSLPPHMAVGMAHGHEDGWCSQITLSPPGPPRQQPWVRAADFEPNDARVETGPAPARAEDRARDRRSSATR